MAIDPGSFCVHMPWRCVAEAAAGAAAGQSSSPAVAKPIVGSIRPCLENPGVWGKPQSPQAIGRARSCGTIRRILRPKRHQTTMKAWKYRPNTYDVNLVKRHDDNSAINSSIWRGSVSSTASPRNMRRDPRDRNAGRRFEATNATAPPCGPDVSARGRAWRSRRRSSRIRPAAVRTNNVARPRA